MSSKAASPIVKLYRSRAAAPAADATTAAVAAGGDDCRLNYKPRTNGLRAIGVYKGNGKARRSKDKQTARSLFADDNGLIKSAGALSSSLRRRQRLAIAVFA